ncbi:MAG: hypothetical protein WBD20_24165 [Pirellulaceae bacterium]
MSINAYAKLNAKLTRQECDGRYLKPLQKHLQGSKLAMVVGGSEKRSKTGEVQHCGIDVELIDRKSAIPVICDFLGKCRAPIGSSLDFNLDDAFKSYAFGDLEGLALYLIDSTDHACDTGDLVDQLGCALGDRCVILSKSKLQSGTAVYAYGQSFVEMQYLIHGIVASHPLCTKSRTIQITPNRRVPPPGKRSR